MKKRIMEGREVSDEQVQAWADEAEAGYDPDELLKQWSRGRPPRAEKASRVVTLRFSEEELAELMARADREGIDRSTAIRAAVHDWATAS
ncbi:MAG: ribbon-helix-helix protein, CopG family [Aeromicrobium sp.]|uniref:ribbon-helix-helix protein, CopG family n=1 Tax=Aeromicrobium sp. TaxID=1871063 RepID=UPI0039E2F317